MIIAKPSKKVKKVARKKPKKIYGKRIKRPAYALKADDIMKKTGATPYNAAIMAGARHIQAETYAGMERYKHLTQMTYRDIAEQEGATARTIIKDLIKRSGINDREEGCKLIKGTDDSFVEAPDDRGQLMYLKELVEICELKKSEAESDPNAQKNRPFDILIKVDGGSSIVQRDVEVIIKGDKK